MTIRRTVARAALGALVLLAGTLTSGASAQEAPKSPASMEAELRKQLESSPRDPELLFKLGNALYDQGRRTEAEQTYLKALESDPKYVKAMVNLGIVLNEGGKSEEALQHFDRAEQLSPADITVLCNKGQALYALQRYSDAVGYYLKAIEIEPLNQLPHYLLGVAFADVGIYREAIREWRLVVSIDAETEAAKTASEGIQVLQGLLPPGDQP